MSRARDLADAGSKANFLDNVTADINTTYAPKDSPTFTGAVGLGSNANGLFNGTISSSATFPAGHVLQTKFQTNDNGSAISITASGNPGTLYGANYGNRTYGLAQTIQITPSSTSNILYCLGQVGWTAFAGWSNGAHGSIITLNDSTSIKNTDYPWYPETNFNGTSSPYWPGEIIWGVFSPSSTSQQTIRLRPYNYREGGTRTITYNFNNLLVMEIAQ